MYKSILKCNSLIIIILLLTSCASYMHGYTQSRAEDKYLIVDKATKSFGYKRMEYNLGYNDSLKGFVKQNGYPDFIYEYQNEEERDSIRMYYVEKDIVYIYESNSWTADSLYLKEYRPLTDYEKATYKELKKTKSYFPENNYSNSVGSNQGFNDYGTRKENNNFKKIEIKSNTNKSSFWIDPIIWKYEKSQPSKNPNKEYEFKYKGKEIYGFAITEEIQVKNEVIPSRGLKNLKKVFPDAKIIKKEYRYVNSNKVIYVEFNFYKDGINFIMCTYYYSDKSGTTQFCCLTSVNLVNKYRKEIADFLNGFAQRS